jgi:hypothetical protein
MAFRDPGTANSAAIHGIGSLCLVNIYVPMPYVT